MPLDTIYIYDDADSEGLDIDYLAGFLASHLPRLRIAVRTDFITHHLSRFTAEERNTLETELSRQLTGAKATRLLSEVSDPFPSEPPEIDLDATYLVRPLQAALRLLIPEAEANLGHLHILINSNLLAEFDPENGLQSGVAALGNPSIVSTSGLIEVPRRPREYNFRRVQYVMLGAEDYLDDLAQQFADQTAGYGDPRINELIKGYLLMAVVYRATGDGPCAEPTCPLFAAHTQAELFQAQAGPDSHLCAHHAALLEAIGGIASH
jgi:hypothetical protein